jgi:hypothetical protein
MSHIVSKKITEERIAKWAANAQPITKATLWTEKRLAIAFGGHMYLLANGQVFQCAHCGHYDPEWSAHEVLGFFKEHFGAKLVEIEIECSIK